MPYVKYQDPLENMMMIKTQTMLSKYFPMGDKTHIEITVEIENTMKLNINFSTSWFFPP